MIDSIEVNELDSHLLKTLEDLLYETRISIEEKPGNNRLLAYTYHSILAHHRSILSSHIQRYEINRSRKSLYRDRQKWEAYKEDSLDLYELRIYHELESMFAFYEPQMPDYAATYLSIVLMGYYLQEAIAENDDPLVIDERDMDTSLETKMRAAQRVLHRWNSYPEITLSEENEGSETAAE